MESLSKEIILEKLSENSLDIRQFGVKKISLFGSYARDEQNEKSDIDFLVEFEKGRGLFRDYTGLLNLLEDLLGKEVDIVKPHLIRKELQEEILEGVKYEAKV